MNLVAFYRINKLNSILRRPSSYDPINVFHIQTVYILFNVHERGIEHNLSFDYHYKTD